MSISDLESCASFILSSCLLCFFRTVCCRRKTRIGYGGVREPGQQQIFVFLQSFFLEWACFVSPTRVNGKLDWQKGSDDCIVRTGSICPEGETLIV